MSMEPVGWNITIQKNMCPYRVGKANCIHKDNRTARDNVLKTVPFADCRAVVCPVMANPPMNTYG